MTPPIAHRLLAPNKPITLVAEIGVNHEGSIASAKRMMKIARDSGADAVKFQTYNPDFYISSDDPERLERVRRFALTDDEFRLLAAYANDIGILFFSTAVTSDKISLIAELAPVIKIASGDITEYDLIAKAADSGADVVLSTGAASLNEIEGAIEVIARYIPTPDLPHRLILLHCVAAYPVPEDQAALYSILRLQSYFSPIMVGYSNHVPSRQAVLAAATLGASVIEVHVSDCKYGRTFRDHALSMDGDDLCFISEQLPKIHSMCKADGIPKKIMPCEQATQSSIRKGLIAARDLEKNATLSVQDIAFARPLGDFSTAEKSTLIGKQINRFIAKGERFKKQDFTQQ